MTKEKGCFEIHQFFMFLLLLVSLPSQAVSGENLQPLFFQDAVTSTKDEKAAEQSLWNSIKDSSDPQAFKTFLAKYPKGQFVNDARSHLAILLGEDYAALFMKRVNLNRQWANVEKQVERRTDIIPRLVESLMAAGVQESELFGQLANARSRLLNIIRAAPLGEHSSKTPEQKQAIIEADKGFSKALKRLDSLLENYPPLRSNERFLKVQDEIVGIENRLNVARIDYNDAVQDYNNCLSESRITVERDKFTEEPTFKSEGNG